ncbi:MAG TPA: aminotransferase class III-fold pyridoxal phosphate-dependent enzyme [Ktedonobacterales bacterium]
MSHVFYRDPRRAYPQAAYGRGVYLWDTAGKQYFDAASGALVANLGHGREDVARAIAEQTSKVALAHTSRFSSPVLERFAARVSRVVGEPGWHVYPVSGGSEATETAVKLARHIHLLRGQPGRYRVLSRRASYHGNTLGALAASGLAERKQAYAPLLSDAFVQVAPPSADCPGIGNNGSCACLDAFGEAIARLGAETIAAAIVELVGGSARSGFVAHAGYVAGLRRLCDAHGILLVFDEVMSGFGRTGRWMAFHHEGVRPDLIVTAKGLAAGYAPLGAVLVAEPLFAEVAEHPAFVHGFTYSGNAVSAAAGDAVLAAVEREGLVENAAREGARLRTGLEALAALYGWIRAVRGRGLMLGLLLEDRAGLAAAVTETAWEQGLILYLGHGEAEGGDSEHLLVAPPLVIAPVETDELLARLGNVLDRVAAAG